jgi:F-type H+-transporting ATPase subunit epsilon
MATSSDIHFVIITPERQVLEDTARSVVFTAHDGELGVLSGRAPLMTELGIGQVRYDAAGRTRRIFIDGGFAQVYDNNVTILTQWAVPVEQITDDVLTEAQREAEAAVGVKTEPEARMQAQRRLSVLRNLRGLPAA